MSSHSSSSKSSNAGRRVKGQRPPPGPLLPPVPSRSGGPHPWSVVHFEINQRVIIQERNTSRWYVGCIYDLDSVDGEIYYKVWLKDPLTGEYPYSADFSAGDSRLRSVPLKFPVEYQRYPPDEQQFTAAYNRLEFVWAALRVPRRYGVDQSSEVWVPAMYLEKIPSSRHSVFVFEGQYKRRKPYEVMRIRAYHDDGDESQ